MTTAVTNTSKPREHRETRGMIRSHATSAPGAVLPMVGIAVVLGAWQVGSMTGVLPATAIPSVPAAARGLIELPTQATFYVELAHTMESWAIGMAITAALAIPLGIIIGSWTFADDSTRGVIEFLKPVPPIALIPLGLLLLGPSMTMKLILIVFGSIWPLLTQVIYGVRDIDGMALAMAKSYRLTLAQRVRHVVLPGVAPYVLTGLRLSGAIALIVAIVTEMIGGVPGLGSAVVTAQNSAALSEMYALIVVTGILGLVINMLFRHMERRVLHWHASQRGVQS